MASPFTVANSMGRASFEGVKRSWDESPQHAFSIEISGQPALYGVWRTKYDTNGIDFGVEVICFGWASIYSIGNPDATTRRVFSHSQAAVIKGLVLTLFENGRVRSEVFPFSANPSGFCGRVGFEDNWILTTN